MRALMLIATTAIMLSSAVSGEEVEPMRPDAQINLRANAVPQGSWVNPHYETRPHSTVTTSALGRTDEQVTPDDALRGSGPSYVSLPAPESRDPGVVPEAVNAVTAKPEVPAKIVDAKAWCRSRVAIGTGAGFCIIN